MTHSGTLGGWWKLFQSHPLRIVAPRHARAFCCSETKGEHKRTAIGAADERRVPVRCTVPILFFR